MFAAWNVSLVTGRPSGAPGTEEECLLSDAELFNMIMREGSAADDDEDYFDDGGLDVQLAECNEESEDPFETLPEMDVIEHNIFDL
ncbi:MAG: hypothetical protein WBV28_22705 [Terracidiphilus sp.]